MAPDSRRGRFSFASKVDALASCSMAKHGRLDDVNILRDEDWIVHLDEETLLSENAVSLAEATLERECYLSGVWHPELL